MEVLVVVIILIHFSTTIVMASGNTTRSMEPVDITYEDEENSENGNESLYAVEFPEFSEFPEHEMNWGIESPEYHFPTSAAWYSGNETFTDSMVDANETDEPGGEFPSWWPTGGWPPLGISPVGGFYPTWEYYDSTENVTNGTNTTTGVNQPIGGRIKLCRKLLFCEYSAINICKKTKLNICQQCSMVKYAVFTTAVILLGLLIIIGNSAVIWSVRKNQKEEQSISELLKTSLAVADLCSGIYIFVPILPNIVWTANHSFNELKTSVIELRGTTHISIIGIIFLLIFLSNLYQLTAYCLIRLYVTVYPFRALSFTRKFNIQLILGVWLLAFISATMPLWFPTVFDFYYQHDYFIYWFEVLPKQKSQLYLIALFLYVVIPYFIMTTSTLTTFIVVRKILNTSRQLTSKQDAIDKKERIVTRNVAIMIFGFTITTAPLFVVNGLLNIKLIKCATNTNAPVFTFYMFYSRSIVNVLVYIATDKKFLRSFFQRSGQESSVNTKTQDSTTLVTLVTPVVHL